MHKSLWKNEKEAKKYSKLSGSKKTDVLIIGGGICGILCAYQLKQKGVSCIVVEGKKIASGTTGNTTAKITFQHGLIYRKILNEYGKEKALMYLTANQRAFSEYEKICIDIDCDFEYKDAYTYSLSERKKIEEEVSALNSLGYDASFEFPKELPFKTEGAIKFSDQAQFNPVKFINDISDKLEIYENTFIKEIRKNIVYSDNGKIKADKTIIATHFPFINKHGGYFLKLYQHRSYVSAYTNAFDLNGMYVDENIKGLSLRNYGEYLLIGGGSHRTGKHGGGWKEIQNFAKKHSPDAGLKYSWAAQDCMSLDKIPYIGNYSKNLPDVYVATGFNKWGMTGAMTSAMILSDMICNIKNDCAEVFSPNRSILKPQLAINSIETTLNLLTPTMRRCPHLGCALKWNKYEHSWDCACHGSRFEKNGSLIDNPAMRDADL